MKRKITLITSLMLFCTLLGAQQVKIMSFNVQQPYNTNWDSRKGNAVTIINSNQPDVIGTQEAHGYMADYIKQNCPDYNYYGQGRECDGGGEGSFIFYKTSKYSIDYANSGNFWFKDNSWECGRGWDPTYNRICTYVRFIEKSSGKAFYVFNSHFPTPGLADARYKSAQLLTSKVSAVGSTTPVICTGDFNSPEGDATTNYFKSGSNNPVQMRDTYRDVHPSGGGNTFGSVKYDYIYVPKSSQTQTLASEILYSPVASDHYVIWASLNLSDGGGSNPWCITIKGSNGNYVSSENGGSSMMCNRPTVGGWEKFDVIDNPDGTFSLRGTNGSYVCSENGGSAMMCNRPGVSGWEKFTWVDLGNSKFAMKGSNGRYVSSENGGSGMMCNRPEIGGWEIFTWATTTKSASIALAIDDEIETVKVYPNPANDVLNIPNALDTDISIVYNMAGLKIMEVAGASANISKLNRGMYLINVNGKIQKFIKK